MMGGCNLPGVCRLCGSTSSLQGMYEGEKLLHVCFNGTIWAAAEYVPGILCGHLCGGKAR